MKNCDPAQHAHQFRWDCYAKMTFLRMDQLTIFPKHLYCHLQHVTCSPVTTAFGICQIILRPILTYVTFMVIHGVKKTRRATNGCHPEANRYFSDPGATWTATRARRSSAASFSTTAWSTIMTMVAAFTSVLVTSTSATTGSIHIHI